MNSSHTHRSHTPQDQDTHTHAHAHQHTTVELFIPPDTSCVTRRHTCAVIHRNAGGTRCVSQRLTPVSAAPPPWPSLLSPHPSSTPSPMVPLMLPLAELRSYFPLSLPVLSALAGSTGNNQHSRKPRGPGSGDASPATEGGRWAGEPGPRPRREVESTLLYRLPGVGRRQLWTTTSAGRRGRQSRGGGSAM